MSMEVKAASTRLERNSVLIVFDDYYGSRDNVIGPYVSRVVDQMPQIKMFHVFSPNPYRGTCPRAWNGKVRLYSNANLPPMHTGRKKGLWTRLKAPFIFEPKFFWTSTVSDDFEIICRLLFDANRYRAVLCFTQSPAYGLSVARLAHVFSDQEIPHLFMISRRRTVSERDLQDLEWLQVRCLADGESVPSIGSIGRPDDEFLFVRFGNIFDGGFRRIVRKSFERSLALLGRHPKGVSTVAGALHASYKLTEDSREGVRQLAVKTEYTLSFLDGEHFPTHSQRSKSRVEWGELTGPIFPFPKRVRNIVLFVHPDWEASGSETAFNFSKAFMRQNDSLFIEASLWPYLVGFKLEERVKKVSAAERQGRPAAAFYLRRSGGVWQHAGALLDRLRKRPRTLSRQLLLYYMGCAAPRLFRDVLNNARINTVFLNHYFTYGFIEPYIKGRKFFLDTHDIQAANFSYYMYRNASTAKVDSFDDMLAEEVEILEKADRLSFISLEEFEFATSFLEEKRPIHFVPLPNVVALPRKKEGKTITLLTLASNNIPNIEGTRWLLNEVWPLVCASTKNKNFKDFTLRICGDIIGKFPARTFEHGELIGRVDDVEREYRKADLILLPVISGSGVAIKTLEALMYERPIIATREALRGLPPKLLDVVGFASSTEAFAAAIVEALTKVENRQMLAVKSAQGAKTLREENYADRLRTCLETVRDEL
ncbi:MAG: glycosyltransferase family 4 protein [Pseudomonadota bacterium]|nr:glycosyltransferase family 4 protein [Pseudomonadota bacterium]